MIRIAALNDSCSNSSTGSEDGSSGQANLTKEALENAAYSLYNKGLGFERAGLIQKATESFESLLCNGFITQSSATISETGQLLPSAILKYSALKNLAKVYSRQDKNQEAIEALLKAVEIDFTDVSVCYRLGLLALKLNHLVLASRAFEKGLELSANHWPCLHNLLTVLYALDNYEGCLCYIAESLVRDTGYVKALVLRKAIYREQPCLETQYAPVFSKCNIEEIQEYTKSLDPLDEQEVMNQVYKLRDVQIEARKPKTKPTVELSLPELSWAALGTRLLELYEYIEDESPALDHSCKLVMNTTKETAAKLTSDGPKEVESSVEKLIEIIHPTHVPMDTTDIIRATNQNTTSQTESDNSQYLVSGSASDSDHNSKEPVNVLTNVDVNVHTNVDVNVVSMDTTAHLPTTSHGSILDQSHDLEVVVVEQSNVETVSEEKEMETETDEELVETMLSDLVQRVSESEQLNRAADVVTEVVNELVDKVVQQQQQVTIKYPPRRSPSDDHIYAKQFDTPSDVEQEKTKKTILSLTSDRKRRSARVKLTTAKQSTVEEKKRDGVDHLSELELIIPSVLRNEKSAEHNYHTSLVSEETSTGYRRPTLAIAADVPFADESGDVKLFLSKFQSNRGVVHVMREWVYTLCGKRSYTWSAELISVFINVYEKHVNSYQRPNIFSSSEVERDALASLLWMELFVDQTIHDTNRRSQLSKIFENDFPYWGMINENKAKLPNICKEFSVRYYHMAAQHFIARHKFSSAVHSYNDLLEFIGNGSELSISLLNNKAKNVLAYSTVSEELKLLERALSLDELQSVYDIGDNHKVISLLSVTFDTDIAKRYTDSRLSQLSLLLNALDKMVSSDDALKWLGETLQEAVHHSDAGRHGNWSSLICKSLTLLSDRLNVKSARECLSLVKVKIVKSCFTVIRVNLEALELEKKMPVNTLYPWILLSKLTQSVPEQAMASPRRASSPTDFPLHIQVLLKAHSLLAKYSLCTGSDGYLLQYTMQLLLDHKQSAECTECTNRQLVEQYLSQCIYCLYGHPNKKIKAKNLTDHGSSTVSISWTAAQQLYDFYKPKSVPEFDSYKSSTISAEMEHILRRLVIIVPKQCQPDPDIESTVDFYLQATVTVEDLNKLEAPQPNILCGEGFYLLADYYFKNKEPVKAIKHYVQDLYYKPGRFDSWAGMALAKSSKLESRLSLMERQSYDGAFQKLAVSTMQAFSRALQLNHDNVKLWIEYACSAYQLHSFSSRIMKTRKAELSSTELTTFTQLKSEMLVKSKYCYIEASQCNDDDFEEEWLHHYMLGKICEKSQGEPQVYLDHYVKAAKCLSEEGAQYPAKISYMYNPSYLAIEALEMHYRIHATILKSLQKDLSNKHHQFYTKVLLEMKESPFATAQVSSPHQSITRKRRPGAEPTDKSTPKRRKSETETSTPTSPVISITTRRQEKLRLDAEIVSEVMEEMLSSVDEIKHVKVGSSSSAESCSDKFSDISIDYENTIIKDVRILIRDVVGEVNRRLSEGNGSSDSLSGSAFRPSTQSMVVKLANEFGVSQGGVVNDRVAKSNTLRLLQDGIPEGGVLSPMKDGARQGNEWSPHKKAEDGSERLMEIDEQDDSSSFILIEKIDKLMEDSTGTPVEGGTDHVQMEISSTVVDDGNRYTDEDEQDHNFSINSECSILDLIQSPAASIEPSDNVWEAAARSCVSEMLDKMETGCSRSIVESTDSSIGLLDVSGRTGFLTDEMSESESAISPASQEVADISRNVVTSSEKIGQSISIDLQTAEKLDTEVRSIRDRTIKVIENTGSSAEVVRDSGCTIEEIKNASSSVEMSKVSGSADIVSKVTVSAVKVLKVSDSAAKISKVAGSATEESKVAGSAADVSKVTDPAAEVSKVAGSAAEVSKVAGSAAEVSKVTGSAAEESKVADPAAEVSKVAGSAAEVSKVTDSATEKSKVAYSAAEVSKVADPAAKVSKVTDSAAEVSKVADSAAEVSKVAGSAAEVSKVADSAAEVPKVADSAAEVPKVADSAAEVSKVAGSAAEVSKVAGSAAEVSKVADPAPEVSKVADSAAEVSKVTDSAAEVAQPASVSITLSKDGLIECCIKALKLCIQRYPLHYKSYFRLAKTFLHDKQRKDVDKVQDLLLGNTGKKKDDKFVPQGLFQDRKHNNFFNGVWRNPVEEIERAGSFGAHLYKTIYLLLQFLHEKRDYHLLYQLHTQLQRTPEQEKKFLKDADRLVLSGKAMEFAIHSLYKVIGLDASSKVEYNYAASLHQAYKWYNYCNRTSICIPNAQVLLTKAYKSYKQALDETYDMDVKVPATEPKEFCQQMFSNRAKDKTKPADSSKQAAAVTESSKPQHTVVEKERGTFTNLPAIRGSLQTLDKSKKARAVLSAIRKEVDTGVQTSTTTTTVATTTTEVSAKSAKSVDIPANSWLNKAKEGTSVLASMFEKPKSNNP